MQQKHSYFGIASLILIIGLDILIVTLWYIITHDDTYSYSLPPSQTVTSARSLWTLSKYGILLALGLGVGGLLQKGRKKLFAILGTVFSATTILLILLGYLFLLWLYTPR